MAKILNNYQNFDDFVKNTKISEKKWLFFKKLTNPESQTFNNAVKSYHAAGYAENKTSKYRAIALYNSAIMQTLLHLWHLKEEKKREIHAETALQKTLREIEEVIIKAKTLSDITNWRGAVMDYAKVNGLLADRHIIETEEPLQIPNDLKSQAIQAAEQLLLNAGDEQSDIIDAEFTEEKPIPAESDDKENQNDIKNLLIDEQSDNEDELSDQEGA